MIPIRRVSSRRKTTILLAFTSFVALAAVGVAQAIGSATTAMDVRTVTVRRAAGPPAGLFVASGRVEGVRNGALAGEVVVCFGEIFPQRRSLTVTVGTGR